MYRTLLSLATASLLCLPTISSAGDIEHGIKFGYARDSSAEISGKHLNLYNPSDPSSYRIENTKTEGAEINDIFSVGYVYRNPLSDNSPFAIDFSATLNRMNISPQTIRLVSQEGPYTTNSDQPDAYGSYLELYFGGTYSFGSAANKPYIGAGVSLITGKANKTFYNLEDLLTGVNTYGQSGRSNMDGTAFAIKGGMDFDTFRVELEHGLYDLHIDAFRSFEINGADLEFDKTMLSMILDF